MSPSPLSFTARQALTAFEDVYLNAMHANQNARYMSQLRVNCQETLVVIGYDRMRAAELVNESAFTLERAESRERIERWSK